MRATLCQRAIFESLKNASKEKGRITTQPVMKPFVLKLQVGIHGRNMGNTTIPARTAAITLADAITPARK